MTVLSTAFVAAYAVVNAFGAWALLHRRRSLAVAFMAVAVVLTIAAVAVAFERPVALPLTVAGAVGASLTSQVNAHVVLGRVVPWRHVLRAGYGALLVTLVALAVRS
jgi:ABC-type cobalamin transport system permease subunit